MAKNKVSTIRVAVCGLTSSSFNGLTGQGAGKSCLCNRFIEPTHDKLYCEHHSVLNLSEFGSNVINNTHFLYWGEKVTALEDGQEIKFQIIEHTEFVDDSSLKPFSNTKPYHKRCTQLKLQSGGKVMYIEPNQLALPEQYTDVTKFPDKFVVDGFVVCVDVSTKFNDPLNPQRDFFERLLGNLQGTKKPIVVACTKFDRAKAASLTAVGDIVSRSKKQLPIIEVSALKGVNVDTCFLVLAHLIDTRKPKTKTIPYSEAKVQLDERVRRNEEALQSVLDERLTDFSVEIEDACKMLKPIVEYQVLIDLCGTERVLKLVRAKLNYLKQLLIRNKTQHYEEMLPNILTAMVPKLPLDATPRSTVALLRRNSKFKTYFVDMKNWKENTEFLKVAVDDQMPFDFLEEEQSLEALKKYIDEVLVEVKAEAATKKIKEVLEGTTDILPGVDMMMLWVDLGLSEEARYLSNEQQVHIYNEYMGKLEQECVADLTELFLERSDLFNQISSSPKETFDRVHTELKDVPRYKRLDHRSQLRMSQALKHIGSLQMPEKSQVYGKSGLQGPIEELEAKGVLSCEKLKPTSYTPGAGDGLDWVLDPKDSCFNLSVLARTEENAMTLRSDFMNHFSGSGTVEVGDSKYQVEISVEHGGDIHSLSSKEFVPQGAVAVVNSLECIDWLRDLVERLWLPQVGRKSPPYRGMPLIILALDKDASSSSEIHKRAQELAGELQCVCLMETPTTQPMRLVISSVIRQILLSIIDAVGHLDTFFNTPLQSNDPRGGGVNIGMFTLVGDPYPNEALLNPLIRHQLVCSNKGDHTLFIKSAIEKQHRTVILSFHSMFNVTVFSSSVFLGVILVYSTERRASLSVLKYLLPKLPKIPLMIIAMTTAESHNEELLKEGEELAQEKEAMFLVNTAPELPTGFAMEFFYKCWFSRFSSWKAQNLSDEVRSKMHSRRALPNRPTDPSSLSRPPGLSGSMMAGRYSVGVLLEQVDRGELPFPLHSQAKSPFHRSTPAVSEEEIYSNPVEQKIGKKGTLERKKRTSIQSPLGTQFFSPEHTAGGNIDLDASKDLSDYASVNDAVKHTEISAGMVNSLRRQPRRSPSMSPPPPPTSPPSRMINEECISEEEDITDEAYATVNTSHKRLTSPTGKNKGYDHLQPDESLPMSKDGYDRLNPQDPPARPPRTDRIKSQGASSSGKYAPLSPGRTEGIDIPLPSDEKELPMYATIDIYKPKKTPPPPADNLYATVDKKAVRSPSPTAPPRIVPRSKVPVKAPNDTMQYRAKKSFPNQRWQSADNVLQQQQQQQQVVESEHQYSTVQKGPRPQPKPRRAVTPEEPMYSVPEKKKKPSPITTKPNSRSPTPVARAVPRLHVSHLRSESFDTGLSNHSTKPTRTQSMDRQLQRPPNNSPLVPQRSPSPQIKTFSSLPSSYRNRAKSREDLEHTRSKEELRRNPMGGAGGWIDPHMDYRTRGSQEELGGGSRKSSKETSPQFSSRRGSREGVSRRLSKEGSPQFMRYPMAAGDPYLDQEDDDEEAPPLPPRNYSWSDIEDSDDDLLQSDDDLDEPFSTITTMDHQKIYASIRRFSMRNSSVNGIEDIYNVINRIVIEKEPTPPNRSEWLPQVAEMEEQPYDTLENVVNSMHKEPLFMVPPPSSSVTTTTSQNTEGGGAGRNAATKPEESLPLTPRDIKMIKQQQKLLQKLQKKMEKEAERRRRQEERKRRREEDEQRRKEGRKKKKGKQKPNERSRYFGSPLASVVDEDGVPVFVRKCVHIIEEIGMNSEGIYRISGKKEHCLAFQEKFDQDPNLDISSLGYQESCICSTLKAFFKLLPEPLISNETASQILVINSLDTQSQRTRVHEILSSMPRPNLCTLRFFIAHLHRVHRKCDTNKMNASNLAIVFWPTLMRPPLMDLADPSKQMGWQLVMTRIIEHPNFIPPQP